LDRPVLITVYYDGDTEPTVTESELYNEVASTQNPSWMMGSAENYTVVAWMYHPKPAINTDGIKYGKREFEKPTQTWNMRRELL